MRTTTYTHLATLLLLAPLLVGCQSKTQLEQVLQAGELRVMTRNAATSYYEGADGPTGPEYDLAKGFADELGVRLKFIPADSISGVLAGVDNGRADFAAAGLTVTPERQKRFQFTPAYQTVTQQLVYRLGSTPPNGLDDLHGKLEIIAASSHAERLRQLKAGHPGLNWQELRSQDSEELLNLVANDELDYTVADSNELSLVQRFHPKLRAAFDISDPQSLAWAFRKSGDDSLYRRAVAYFHKLEANGGMARIVERYYGHLGEFDYVGTRIYMNHIRKRLPGYRNLLQTAASENELDWRLLAAMAYQESHWDPAAISPTGVRGFMQLTKATASYLGVEKRTDIEQSIDGGARYIRQLIDKVPDRIQDPDRLWMAIAAYNVGYGHLNDARIITQRRGMDADAWSDVKKNLPLLRDKKWYHNTRYGYARGDEAAAYVENIRSYFDILVWLTERQRPTRPAATTAALAVTSPVL